MSSAGALTACGLVTLLSVSLTFRAGSAKILCCVHSAADQSLVHSVTGALSRHRTAYL